MGAVGSDLSPPAASQRASLVVYCRLVPVQRVSEAAILVVCLSVQAFFSAQGCRREAHMISETKTKASESPSSSPPSWLPALIPAANGPICGKRRTRSLLQTAGGPPFAYSLFWPWKLPSTPAQTISKRSPTTPPPFGLFYIRMMQAGALLPVWAHQDNPVR